MRVCGIYVIFHVSVVLFGELKHFFSWESSPLREPESTSEQPYLCTLLSLTMTLTFCYTCIMKDFILKHGLLDTDFVSCMSFIIGMLLLKGIV